MPAKAFQPWNKSSSSLPRTDPVQNFRCGITNGCGPCESHGGGCGAHAGTVTGGVTGVTIPGNGVKPAGFPIPLDNGVNDAPAGSGTKSGCVMLGSKTGAVLGTEKNLLSGDGSEAETGLGSSNCRNRSIVATCSISGFVGVCGADGLNESHP